MPWFVYHSPFLSSQKPGLLYLVKYPKIEVNVIYPLIDILKSVCLKAGSLPHLWLLGYTSLPSFCSCSHPAHQQNPLAFLSLQPVIILSVSTLATKASSTSAGEVHKSFQLYTCIHAHIHTLTYAHIHTHTCTHIQHSHTYSHAQCTSVLCPCISSQVYAQAL